MAYSPFLVLSAFSFVKEEPILSILTIIERELVY